MADPFSTDQLLHMAITEHVAPGQKVDLYLQMPREIGSNETQMLQDYLRGGGLKDATVQFGSTSKWQNALHLNFTRPAHLVAPSQFQLIALLAGGLAILGVGGFSGWKIGTAVSSNLIPLALIGTAGAILVALVVSKGNAKYDIAVRR